MVLLVFVHGYNLNNRYLQPFTPVEEAMSANAFAQYFFANGIFRFRIPMLFIISGYLFALHDDQPHKVRIRKRLRTVLLPYFIWSIIGLLIAVVLSQWSATREAVYQTRLQPVNKPFETYTFGNWVSAVLWPTSYQLWFLRCLFVYNLLYPLLLKGISKMPVVLFTVFTLMWLSTFGIVLIEGEGLLFFTLGIWLCKKQLDIEHPPHWLNLPVCAIVFITAAAAKTWLAFKGLHSIGTSVFPMLILLHKLVVFTGLAVVWFGCDRLVRYFMRRKWFIGLSAFSFMIYALHVPLVTYLIDPFFSLVNNFRHYRMVTFIFLPLLLIAFCIAVGWLLRKTFPKVYGVLTGGRGFNPFTKQETI